MDPLSQAVTGAAAAALGARRENLRPALWLGALAGEAADLDIFIRSESDPLLRLEYHRHFTHALAFAPAGALFCAGFFWLFPFIRRRVGHFGECYLICLLGYATHGALDACTTYGTLYWWPFSDARISWNIIAIIDPLYTLPALILVLFSAWKRSNPLALAAMLWMLTYLSLGAMQESRARSLAAEALQDQAIRAEEIAAFPTMGNLWLWRIVYPDRARGRWQAHGLYLPLWGGEHGWYSGETAEFLPARIPQSLPPGSTAWKDFHRFRRFSQEYLAWYPNSRTIGDFRYSDLPDGAASRWSIALPDDFIRHAIRHSLPRENSRERFWQMLRGQGADANLTAK